MLFSINATEIYADLKKEFHHKKESNIKNLRQSFNNRQFLGLKIGVWPLDDL